TDIGSAIAGGSLRPGDSLLAPGGALPEPFSLVNGELVSWSGLVYAGGLHLLAGVDLFRKHQGFYDPRVVWAGSWNRLYTPVYWARTGGIPFMSHAGEASAPNGLLVTPGVLLGDRAAGQSSRAGASGLFAATSFLARLLGQGIALS